MKRPNLVHFMAIKTSNQIQVRASVTLKENLIPSGKNPGIAMEIAQGIVKEIEKEIPKPRFPIQAFRLLTGEDFELKIVGLDKNRNEVYKKNFESDQRGYFNFKIPFDDKSSQISVLQVYETSFSKGLEIHLGTFIPLEILDPKKIIICDFDKTLVDTKYSTTKEVYHSLTKPLEHFPTVTHSVELLKEYIKKGYHPFILSASPHFYEDAMRDWLYKNKIFSAGIFLKDYRKVFNFLDLDLTPKDLKVQGIYKLNHLLDILLMTGIPDELVLMGDNFESDPVIYLTLYRLLESGTDPWKLWKTLSTLPAFQMNKKQNSQMLNKFYHLNNHYQNFAKDLKKIKIEIYIRKKVNEDKIVVPSFVTDISSLVKLYDGVPAKIVENQVPK